MKINPSDPKWTAYVLGELDDKERAAIEEFLQTSSEARAIVEEVRIATAMLKDELASQPAMELNAAQRASIRAAAEPEVRRWNGPRVFRWATGFAAAGLILAVALTPFVLPSREVTRSEPALLTAQNAPENSETRVTPAQQPSPRLKAQAAAAAAEVAPALQDKKEEESRADLAKDVRREVDSIGVNESGGIANGILKTQPVAAPAARVASAPPPPPPPPAAADRALRPAFNTEANDRTTDNPFVSVSQNPLATFSPNVDTASYANVRRFLNQNTLPPKDAVRIEEMINYFTYDYPQPAGPDPVGAAMEVASAPWNAQHRLVRIAITGEDIARNVKVEIEFNPAQVNAYRLIGGYGVTALFEVVPAGVDTAARSSSREMLKLTIRYKDPKGSESKLMDVPLADSGKSFTSASADYRFAASVGAFGMILRDSPYKGSASLSDVLDMAEASKGEDRNRYRDEFISLVNRARDLQSGRIPSSR